jgi:molecular chaperone GrpE
MKDRQDKNDATVDVEIEDDGANSAQPDTAVAGADDETREEAPLTADELAKLKEQAAKAQENWDRLLRLNADFDNFKKRTAKDRLEAIKFANEDIIERLLPVLDNFEAALAAGNNADASSVGSLLTGVKMILGQLKGVVTDAGLEEIDAQGKPFDPVIHEALSQEPSDEIEEGHVLKQMRKGYKLRDRLLRPASVVVSGKAESDEESQS